MNGENIIKHHGVTMEKCQALCDENPACLGVEFFVESDAANRSSAYKEGDCNESSGTDITGCDYKKWQM